MSCFCCWYDLRVTRDDVGYDLRTEETYNETWDQFDKIVGFKYLSGLHLNDSRSALGSKRDLHANLGYSSS
jgi:endonuclease IV